MTPVKSAVGIDKASGSPLNLAGCDGVEVVAKQFDVEGRVSVIVGLFKGLALPDLLANAVVLAQQLDLRPLGDRR